jgi:hypothetical protein
MKRAFDQKEELAIGHCARSDAISSLTRKRSGLIADEDSASVGKIARTIFRTSET